MAAQGGYRLGLSIGFAALVRCRVRLVSLVSRIDCQTFRERCQNYDCWVPLTSMDLVWLPPNITNVPRAAAGRHGVFQS
jgi:hypothetical protein